MKNNNMTLESGKEYSLSQLFSGDNKIVIPDLQRDYCWGDKAWDKDKKNYTELVSSFIKNLLSSYKDKPNDNLILGLIYGYENPKYHIQLSDGQQRITTLFLLIGMLDRRVKNKFQEHLISDYELKHDDKEPYLLYAIRESTLYFLGDLVNEFFLKAHIKKVEDIIKQDWYFKEYDLDSSIQSMISALKTLEHLLDESERGDDFSYENFGKFILEKLKMIYYDMGNRTRGEETFVIINTTGEPLTATENLKPILIGNIKDENIRNKSSKEWEDREEWFWQNRNEKETTSDSALNDFFIWYWQIRLLQEKSKSNSLNPRELFLNKPKTHNENEENPQIERWEKSIKTETINSYFKALRKLIELSKDEKTVKVLKTIKGEDVSLNWFRKADLNVVLPLIAYLEKFKEPKYFYELVRRIRKNYFDNKWKERKANYIDWRYIIQIIEKSVNEIDVLRFDTKNKVVKISNVDLNEWYDNDEKFKQGFNKETVIKLENHKYLGGRLDLFEELCTANNSKSFEEFAAKFINLPFENSNKELWRALLTFEDYIENVSDIIKDNLWHKIFFTQKRKLLIKLITKENINDYLKGLKDFDCSKFDEKWREPLIKNENILKNTSRMYYKKTNEYIRLQNVKGGGRYIYIYPEREKFYKTIGESINFERRPWSDKIVITRNGIKIVLKKSINNNYLIIGVLKLTDNATNKTTQIEFTCNTQYPKSDEKWEFYRKDNWDENKNNTDKYIDELNELIKIAELKVL